MKYQLVLFSISLFLLGEISYSQDKLFFNRIHLFEHQECQHPIGTVIIDKVFYGNNADNTTFMNFNNSGEDIAFVDLVNYGKYTAYNQFLRDRFIGSNKVMMGFRENAPSISASIKEARSRFRLAKVKDTILDGKTLRHFQIRPKDTLIHRFESYNIFVNTEAKTEVPIFTSPTAYFLVLGSLKDLKGTVVETYFIDLEGYIFCRDVLSSLLITNKRVILN